MKFIYSLLLSLFLITSVFAQTQLEGELRFHGFVDNREYVKSGRNSQTILGSRLAAETGLFIDSTHRIRFGLNALKEYGDSSKFVGSILPTIYYEYQYNKLDFYIGSFPRYPHLKDYPRLLLNDTLDYYKPNIEGMLLKYKSDRFAGSLWIDWVGKQSKVTREAFLVGLDARLTLGKFFINHYGYMYHKAFSENPANEFLEDNAGSITNLGIGLKNVGFLDSLTLSAGPVFSFERVRSLTNILVPKGFVANLEACYKRFFVENRFYSGQGHHLLLGDSFYTSKLYNRLDIGWVPLLTNNLEGRLKLSFHFVDNAMDNQQSFILRYRISGSKKVGK
ncbi:hypothetical protein Pedsa_2378 [Pseudopedobacter saltans DSM 12145]|uniref:Bacterial surface antigen (D15) domain-containing protein n=1 Tax=Pseudopedobacter saltans (strain ATCC 51119 / DSM 12145 / JCM 21818 / CCUG 39354 / LMG 10337 / NBRC 100064 / NCIMB 13643) TaxID=762903 RepID=F0SE00_PSESL|nr:hypothetical protein [Pseudopedobacter saltans]ADY52926.1 hypothetical protein Pedsa_2378 [Pseudopedobacter saltans DSM 12145]